MRLIDADALPTYTGYALSADEVATAVENAPTIDATPVIRCKDCLWFEKKNRDGLGFCLENGKYWMENDYCSYGERSDNVNG